MSPSVATRRPLSPTRPGGQDHVAPRPPAQEPPRSLDRRGPGRPGARDRDDRGRPDLDRAGRGVRGPRPRARFARPVTPAAAVTRDPWLGPDGWFRDRLTVRADVTGRGVVPMPSRPAA